jgi:hypothetical protein
MATKPKKGPSPGTLSGLARDRVPMVSVKTKKSKKTSRGK